MKRGEKGGGEVRGGMGKSRKGFVHLFTGARRIWDDFYSWGTPGGEETTPTKKKRERTACPSAV